MAMESDAFLMEEEQHSSLVSSSEAAAGAPTSGRRMQESTKIESIYIGTNSAAAATIRTRRPQYTAALHFLAQAQPRESTMEPITVKRVRPDPSTCNPLEDQHQQTFTIAWGYDTQPKPTGTACTTIDHFKPLKDFDMRSKYMIISRTKSES